MEREILRMALPSKGRMAEDTLQLLKVHMQHSLQHNFSASRQSRWQPGLPSQPSPLLAGLPAICV